VDADPYPLLDAARRDFPGFYASATRDDAVLLDVLIRVHAAFSDCMALPRDMPPALRAHVVSLSNALEQSFLTAQQAVRQSPSFRALRASDRARIEAAVFQLNPRRS
jgi:hypothetical protein